VDPKYFHKGSNLPQIMQHVNNSIQNSGITKSMSVLFEFSRNIWGSIDSAINLDDCDIYSFDPEEDDFVDNPFSSDSGCMYISIGHTHC
jgi:Maf1 regulator